MGNACSWFSYNANNGDSFTVPPAPAPPVIYHTPIPGPLQPPAALASTLGPNLFDDQVGFSATCDVTTRTVTVRLGRGNTAQVVIPAHSYIIDSFGTALYTLLAPVSRKHCTCSKTGSEPCDTSKQYASGLTNIEDAFAVLVLKKSLVIDQQFLSNSDGEAGEAMIIFTPNGAQKGLVGYHPMWADKIGRHKVFMHLVADSICKGLVSAEDLDAYKP